MHLPELELGIASLFVDLLLRAEADNTNQTQNLFLWEEPKTVQGQGKDCICFQVLLHDSDV